MPPGFRPCHCLCAVAHPAEPGICKATEAVTTARYDTRLLGPVDVPLCWPCRLAQSPALGADQVNLWMLIRPGLAADIAAARP